MMNGAERSSPEPGVEEIRAERDEARKALWDARGQTQDDAERECPTEAEVFPGFGASIGDPAAFRQLVLDAVLAPGGPIAAASTALLDADLGLDDMESACGIAYAVVGAALRHPDAFAAVAGGNGPMNRFGEEQARNAILRNQIEDDCQTLEAELTKAREEHEEFKARLLSPEAVDAAATRLESDDWFKGEFPESALEDAIRIAIHKAEERPHE